MRPNVYVVNKSGHNIEDAKRFGDIVHLSDGPQSRYATNNIYRQFRPILENSHPDDYILLTGLTVMNVIAASVMALTHGRLNMLIHRPKDDTYIWRRLDMSDLQAANLEDIARDVLNDTKSD